MPLSFVEGHQTTKSDLPPFSVGAVIDRAYRKTQHHLTPRFGPNFVPKIATSL
jgi:hypothetical protein